MIKNLEQLEVKLLCSLQGAVASIELQLAVDSAGIMDKQLHRGRKQAFADALVWLREVQLAMLVTDRNVDNE